MHLDDGTYAGENIAAEHSVGPFTIGRNDWMYARPQSGATESANLNSLVARAKINGLNPFEYL